MPHSSFSCTQNHFANGLEACSLNKTQTQSLDFVINRLFMTLVNIPDIVIVKQRQEQFNFALPSVALERRRTKYNYA